MTRHEIKIILWICTLLAIAEAFLSIHGAKQLTGGVTFKNLTCIAPDGSTSQTFADAQKLYKNYTIGMISAAATAIFFMVGSVYTLRDIPSLKTKQIFYALSVVVSSLLILIITKFSLISPIIYNYDSSPDTVSVFGCTNIPNQSISHQPQIIFDAITGSVIVFSGTGYAMTLRKRPGKII